MGSLFDWFGGNSSNTSTQTKLNKLEKDLETVKENISAKVDKEDGKGLSTNDFTDEDKNKLNGITLNNIISDPVMEVSTVTSEPSVGQVGNTDYVTPQMFGAVGNGWTDDTEAIQKAIDSNFAVYFPRGEYVINNSLIIDNKKFWNLYAQDATIIYKGSDYAFRILNVMQSNIKIGYIMAENGGGIEFYSDSRESWNQYVVLDFNCIGAKTDCIHIETADNGWCNENHVYGGRFLSGENGVNIVSRSHHTINGWKFYNCGIEGVTNGFMFDATEDEETAICNMVISNCRYGESFETILKTNGLVYDCLWLAPSPILPSFIVASPETTRFIIDAPIGTYWHMHDTAYIRGAIMDGKLVGERPEYKVIK